MIETVIIAIAVTVAAGYIGASLYRSVTGKKTSACQCRQGCAVSKQCPSAQIGPAARRDAEN